MEQTPNAYPANMTTSDMQQGQYIHQPGGMQGVPSAPNPYPPQYGYGDQPSTPSVIAPHIVRSAVPEIVQESAPASEEKDIYSLTPHVQLTFEDTFKEGDSARGFPFMKTVNSAIYKYTLFGVYASFALIIGPIISFIWAIIFAFIQISVVWMVQPSMKAFFITFRLASMIIEATVRLILDPIFRSWSLIYSNIKGRFQVDDSSISVNVKTDQVQNA